MKKILFVIGSLQLGGAETVLTDMANSLCDKFDITLLLLEKRGPLLEQLNKKIDVKYVCLGNEYCNNGIEKRINKIKLSSVYRFFGDKSFFSRYVHSHILNNVKYDVEVAFLSGILADIVRMSPNKESKKIAWIHCEVTKDDISTYNKYKKITIGFDSIVGVSESSIKIFEETFPNTKGKITLIHNYIDVNKIINKANIEEVKYDNGFINFVSIGRICSDKGFDRIINIAKKYDKKIIFNIIGDGPDKKKIESSIKEKKISNVKLLGLKTNPYPYIKNADYFLLSSRSEAYPTVVIEAMILGKPIIATDVSGVREILQDYNNKIILPNNDNSIEEGINKIIKANDKKVKENNTFVKNNNNNLEKIIKLFNE